MGQIIYFDKKKYLDHLSLDCVVFGFYDNQLKVLLNRIKSTKEWALPGGFIQIDESLDISANRILKERTGLDNIFLKPFNNFSDPKRSNNTTINNLEESHSMELAN